MANAWNVQVTTFNCAKKFPFDDDNAKTSILNDLLPNIGGEDVYVFGFQELTSTWEASFPDIVRPKVQDLANFTLKYINSRAPSRGFRLIGSTSTGAVGIIAIADQSIEVRKVAYSNFRCGLFNSSLKGSSSLCCTLRKPDNEQETFTFICSHLNANEGPTNAELRVSNCASILSSCATDFRLMPFKTSHVFFFGDLNFRVNGLQNTDIDYSNPDTLQKLLKTHEELNKLRESNLVFDGFDEGQIDFPPTYKYLVSQAAVFDPKRSPSWCDRILFKHYEESNVKILSYGSVSRTPSLRFTDHQAVILNIRVPYIQSKTELKIPTAVISPQQVFVGNIADTLIGYLGWALVKKLHYGLIAILGLMILYNLV